MSEKLLDLEIMVRCVIRGAASKSELKKYYADDPLKCAKELAENERGLCGTIDSFQFEITEARVRQ